MKKASFFEEFLKNWREVGSITPSSKYLVKKMLQTIDFERAKLIVEFGAGSGIMTLELLKNMKEDCKLVVFETNKDFYNDLAKIDDKRLTVYHQSALKLEEYLVNKNIDYIVSGIPLAVLDEKDKLDLLNFSYNTLKLGGRYIQFQYSLESRKDLNKVFDKVDVDFTPLNIPPAFVFSCLKN